MTGFVSIYVESKTNLDSDFIKKFQIFFMPLGDVGSLKIQRYWKINEYLEIHFNISNVKTTFGKVLRHLEQFATPWLVSNSDEEASFIWNKDNKSHCFFDERIRWINFEIFP